MSGVTHGVMTSSSSRACRTRRANWCGPRGWNYWVPRGKWNSSRWRMAKHVDLYNEILAAYSQLVPIRPKVQVPTRITTNG